MCLSKPIKLILSILICQLTGFLGSVFTIPAISSWYVYLNKPPFSPPNWLFGPVWIFLYTLMGISLYYVWEATKKKSDKFPLVLFFVNLLLNFSWSVIFFGFHNPGFALMEIIGLWFAIVLMIRTYQKINIKAAILLYPYLLWVFFAAILNASILLLN